MNDTVSSPTTVTRPAFTGGGEGELDRTGSGHHERRRAGDQGRELSDVSDGIFGQAVSSRRTSSSGAPCGDHRELGSGQATLGRILADRLGVPYVELDGIFHQRNWSKLRPAEFERLVAEVANQPSWILDGSYSAVRHVVWPRADCVVWIDLPRLLVTYRVFRRTVHRYATRQELWNGNRDRWQDMFSTDPETSAVAAAWKRYPEQAPAWPPPLPTLDGHG